MRLYIGLDSVDIAEAIEKHVGPSIPDGYDLDSVDVHMENGDAVADVVLCQKSTAQGDAVDLAPPARAL